MTSLIVNPIARAIAGTNGRAIADTLSLAILKRGSNTQIEFNPDAVAIVGPGGIAHAENTLDIINYEMPSKTVLLPYYGAAKGQMLKINEFSNGTTTTSIIQKPSNLIESILPELTTTKIRHIKNIYPLVQSEQYAENLKNINSAALKLLELQKNPNSPEKDNYDSIVDLLSKSSEQLASFSDKEQRAGLDEWFSKKAGNKNKNESNNKKVVPSKGNSSSSSSSNKNKGGEEENQNEGEGVAVELPADESSIAEAKPVGLAIAGIGGMASSKPIATAVVGPGGLAVARPVATAIAGVSPDEALVPLNQRPPSASVSKPTQNKEDSRISNYSEYLNKLISKYHQV